jgi:glucose/arabinose dehydrogenase
MSRRHSTYSIVLILSLLALNGCRAMGLFHREISDTPAPTAIPLPSVTSTAEGLPRQTPEPTETPTPKPTATETSAAPTSGAEAAPTRVVPPESTVNLPHGFGISVFVAGLNGPRMMTLGPDDQIYVAERGAGRIIRLPDPDGDGVADGIEVAASGLNAPSSIDFYRDGSLYVGETTRILRLSDPDGDGVFQEQVVIIDGLPAGGHSTRTVLFSPDWEHLYVSIGSSCNVCLEEDPRRATIMRYRPDGSEGETYAQGLRNAVGIAFRPGTNELWATNNGRDWLGDNQPPETVYRVDEGDDAGWPRCHSGRIVDPDYGEPGACEGVADPAIEMQAHSAPLGLAFYTGRQFPEDYQGDLFIAFHGSWNRTVPTGYKVVRVPVQDGEIGPLQDFAAGWLREDGSRWGRPVDVLTGPDGSLLISDDGEGFIYRVFYTGE